MAKKETQPTENKVEQLKKQVDEWANNFINSEKKFERFDLYQGNSLQLGLIAYRDKDNVPNILISIHGKKPTNSVSFPSNSLSEIEKIFELITKYKELFEYVGKYQTKKEKKALLE